MFTMAFAFNRDERGTDQINAALAGLSLSELHIKKSDGYLASKRTFGEHEERLTTEYEYGFEKIEFECEQQEGQEQYIYQMDVAVFPKDEIESSDVYHDLWCADHPRRVMRIMQQISFDNADAFVVLHHARG